MNIRVESNRHGAAYDAVVRPRHGEHPQANRLDISAGALAAPVAGAAGRGYSRDPAPSTNLPQGVLRAGEATRGVGVPLPTRGMAKPRPAGSLKDAVAQLVAACGNQVEAARVCRESMMFRGSLSHQTVAAYTDDGRADRHMPVDIVAALEAKANDPIVTRYLASRAHAVLLPLDPAMTQASYAVLLSAIGKETGEFFAEAAQALADGRLIGSERGRARAQAVEAMTALAAFVADIDQGDIT